MRRYGYNPTAKCEWEAYVKANVKPGDKTLRGIVLDPDNPKTYRGLCENYKRLHVDPPLKLSPELWVYMTSHADGYVWGFDPSTVNTA